MSFIAHEGGSLSNVADGVGVRGAQTKCRDRPRLKRLVGLHLVLREQVIVLSAKSMSRAWLRNIDRLIFVCTAITRLRLLRTPATHSP
jgi:hypothetical protein